VAGADRGSWRTHEAANTRRVRCQCANNSARLARPHELQCVAQRSSLAQELKMCKLYPVRTGARAPLDQRRVTPHLRSEGAKMAELHYMEMGWSGSGWMDPLPVEPAPAPPPSPATPATAPQSSQTAPTPDRPRKPAKKASRPAAKKAKKAPKKAAKRAAKKPRRKAAKKGAKKAARKASRRPARKAAKKSAKRSARKRGRRR